MISIFGLKGCQLVEKILGGERCLRAGAEFCSQSLFLLLHLTTFFWNLSGACISIRVDAAGSKNGFLYAAGPRISQQGGVQIPFILHRSRAASQREKRRGSVARERKREKGKRKEGKTKKKQEKKRKSKEKKQHVF